MLTNLLSGTFDPIAAFYWIIGIVIAISFHEAAHAYTADLLGDKTPRYQGRRTLDPLAHLDPVGTLLILLVGFGWGRPVQFNPLALKNPAVGAALISIAGPATNFVLAIVFATLIRINVAPTNLWLQITVVNVMLGIFNLIPVAPLDGEKIVAGLLPTSLRDQWIYYQQYGVFLLLIVVLTLGTPLSILVRQVVSLLIGQP